MESMQKCECFSFANERYIAEITAMLRKARPGYVASMWEVLLRRQNEFIGDSPVENQDEPDGPTEFLLEQIMKIYRECLTSDELGDLFRWLHALREERQRENAFERGLVYRRTQG